VTPLTLHLFDAASLLHAFGPWVLAGIALLVTVESGLLFPFLPGDSLLVTAAILGATLGVTPWQVALVAVVAAVVGDVIGYVLGARVGRRLFRPGARVLTPARLRESEAFFTRWGGVSLVLGRFVPVGGFVLWNVLGAVAWVGLLVTAGVLLGGTPLVADHIDAVMIVVVVVSVLPLVVGALLRRRRRTAPPGSSRRLEQ
jgi:membrane-associated protein